MTEDFQTAQFHFTMRQGWSGEPLDFYCENGQWHLWYEYRTCENGHASKVIGHAVSKDLIHWKEEEATLGFPNSQSGRRGRKLDDANAGLWHGYASELLTYRAEDGRFIVVGFSEAMHDPDKTFAQQLLIPVELTSRTTERGVMLQASPVRELRNLRVWQRSWPDIEIGGTRTFEASLQFRVAPGEWPNIRIVSAEDGPGDIASDMLDVELELEAYAESLLEIRLYGLRVLLDSGRQTIESQGVVAPLALNAGKIKLRLLLDKASLEIFACGGEVVMALPAAPSDRRRNILLKCHRGKAKIRDLEVFGLRGVWPSPEERPLITEAMKDETLVYRSESYAIYKHRIEDSVYGEPPAYVPDRDTIWSPTRVIEDFHWSGPYSNDMTRVIGRGNVWHPHGGIAGLPDIRTGHATIDAAYRLATDIFYRCGSEEFARPGEEGMWTAGQFQGPGEGFGVWVRDTAHVAIRMGNILDPAGARRSLLFTTRDGFDNGVDGTAMPIVGIGDYYSATGDLTLAEETWANLKTRIAKLEKSFDPERGLIPADQSTSNDAFPEPENGGFSLATEIYFMEAFRAMARMGARIGETDEQVKAWAERGERLLRNIQSQYWSEEAGYFTSGPIGSESHVRGYWESAGQEIALWPRYGVATPEQRRRILERLPEVAMNEFGVNVFPYRSQSDHFCHSAWVVWTSGMAAAAGREGRLDLLMTFIAQQARNSVMNKTFYEAIDYRTGKAWRWPGQLWHAAGFISYFFLGVLGMEYDERGLTFAPAVPEALRDLKVENVRYRNAVFDIVVQGWGTAFAMKCDGKTVSRIPADMKGKHRIEFWEVSPRPFP